MTLRDIVKPHIRGLAPYEPGKPPEQLERELGIEGAIKLASNESPIGPSPLAVAAVRDALARRRVPCVAVSPLIGGRAVKGPADRMLRGLAGGTSPRHVAGCYAGLIDALVVDDADADDLDGLGAVRPIVTRTLMADADARRRLAETALGVVPA